MSEAVIIAAISAGFPMVTTLVTALLQRRSNEKHAAKQSILQMIMEAVMEGQLPTNYQNILHEYDIYHKNGGNSYVTEKVENYKTWFLKVQGGKK